MRESETRRLCMHASMHAVSQLGPARHSPPFLVIAVLVLLVFPLSLAMV